MIEVCKKMEKFLKKLYNIDNKILDTFDFEKQRYKINLKIEKKFVVFRKLVKKMSLAFVSIIFLLIGFIWYSDVNNSKPDINYIVKAELYEHLDMYENYDIINNIETYLDELKKIKDSM